MVQGHSAHGLHDQDLAPDPCSCLDATRLLKGKGRDADVGASSSSCLGTLELGLQVTEALFNGEAFTWMISSPGEGCRWDHHGSSTALSFEI